MLHPPARTRSSRRGPRRPAPTGRSCRTPRGVRVLRSGRGAQLRRPARRRLAPVLRDLRAEPPWPGRALALTEHDWQTPLGIAMADKGLHDALSKPPLEDDILAHRDEHSIEVQLPFLQELSDAVRFVPICMAFQEYDLAVEVGDLVAQTIRGKDVLLIASSDFTHVGSQYFQIAPADVTAPAFAKGQDAKAIEQIVALDPKHFAAKVAQDDISMCGYGAVTAMLTAAKVLGAREAKLLKYATSSDVSRDTKMAVGYGAIAVYR